MNAGLEGHRVVLSRRRPEPGYQVTARLEIRATVSRLEAAEARGMGDMTHGGPQTETQGTASFREQPRRRYQWKLGYEEDEERAEAGSLLWDGPGWLKGK